MSQGARAGRGERIFEVEKPRVETPASGQHPPTAGLECPFRVRHDVFAGPAYRHRFARGVDEPKVLYGDAFAWTDEEGLVRTELRPREFEALGRRRRELRLELPVAGLTIERDQARCRVQQDA